MVVTIVVDGMDGNWLVIIRNSERAMESFLRKKVSEDYNGKSKVKKKKTQSSPANRFVWSVAVVKHARDRVC